MGCRCIARECACLRDIVSRRGGFHELIQVVLGQQGLAQIAQHDCAVVRLASVAEALLKQLDINPGGVWDV